MLSGEDLVVVQFTLLMVVHPLPPHRYICCVTVGTCDSGYVSNSARYYEGGCTGVNYAANSTMIASASTSDDFPSTIDGCVKQGECNLPFLEQIKHWTATGGGLTTETVPDDVMDRLLVGATESYADACRDASLHGGMAKVASWRGHGGPPRAPRAAPEGVRPPSALRRRGPASPIVQGGRGIGATPHQSHPFRCV